MSLSQCGDWNVRASFLARNTLNPIRDIIENLHIKPNPKKTFIPLSVGDPTLFGNIKPPKEVLNAVRDSLHLNDSRGYGPLVGHYEARKAIAEYSAFQGEVAAEDVIITSGCSHAIELAVTTLAEARQNILVPRPGYAIHKTIGEGLGILINLYDLMPKHKWEVDLTSLESAIDSNTAAIVVNNPSNPCGSVYSKEHLCKILDVASRYRVPIIADEIYEQFVFPSQKFTSISSVSRDVPILTCSGISKTFLAPGWRLGWLIIHDRNKVLEKEVRKGLMNMCGRILGANTLIQKALPRILKCDFQEDIKNGMVFLKNQAELVCFELQKAPGLHPMMPQGSMYMMVEIRLDMFPRFKNELEFIKELCSEQSVLCIPSECFNYSGFLRIVLTVPEDILREACQRIIIFCKQHVSSDNEKICLFKPSG